MESLLVGRWDRISVVQLHEEREKLQTQLNSIITNSRLIITSQLEEAKEVFASKVNETIDKLEELYTQTLQGDGKAKKQKEGAARKTFFPQDSYITVMLTEEHFRTIFNIGKDFLFLLLLLSTFGAALTKDLLLAVVVVRCYATPGSADGAAPVRPEHRRHGLLREGHVPRLQHAAVELRGLVDGGVLLVPDVRGVLPRHSTGAHGNHFQRMA